MGHKTSCPIRNTHCQVISGSKTWEYIFILIENRLRNLVVWLTCLPINPFHSEVILWGDIIDIIYSALEYIFNFFIRCLWRQLLQFQKVSVQILVIIMIIFKFYYPLIYRLFLFSFYIPCFLNNATSIHNNSKNIDRKYFRRLNSISIFQTWF